MPTTETFTADATWTAPSVGVDGFDVLATTLQVHGTGGGSGTGSVVGGGGGGGGGGAYAAILAFATTPANVYTIEVGQSSNTANRQPTWFSSTGVVPANTTEGAKAEGGAQGINDGNGGGGGGAGQSIGDALHAGGDGGNGGAVNGGGGGGGAGTNNNGTNGVNAVPGNGGAADGGAGGDGATAVNAATPGLVNGGGGGGASTTLARSAGARGRVRLIYGRRFYRDQFAVGKGVASMPAKKIILGSTSFPRARLAGVATLTRKLTLARVFAPVLKGVATVQKRKTFAPANFGSAVAKGVASISKKKVFAAANFGSAVMRGVATIQRKIIKAPLAAIMRGVASMDRRLALLRVVAARLSGVPSFARRLTIKRTLAATLLGRARALIQMAFEKVPSGAAQIVDKIIQIIRMKR